MKQLLSALEHIHSFNIVHRDIKPDNILCEVDENKIPVKIKIADFGLARKLSDDTKTPMTTHVRIKSLY